MKKKILLIVAFIILVLRAQTYAQQISPDVISHFSPSIIARVYEVTSKINLSPERQLLVANQFKYEDSSVSTMIAKGLTSAAISKYQNEMQTAFQKLLTASESSNYYSIKVNGAAKKEGQIMAKLMQQKYNCDTSLQNILADLYYKRKMTVDKAFYSQFADSSALDNRLLTVMSKYDSLIAKYTSAAAGSAYLNNMISVLDSIKALSDKEKNGLKNNFANLCIRRDKSFADNFNDAMHNVITDTAYYAAMYKDEIGRTAASNYAMEITSIVGKNKSTKDGMRSLAPIVLEKEKKIATINYAFPYFTKSKESILQSTTKYYDSLVNNALLHDGSVSDKSKFSLAVKHRQQLVLSQTQVDTLLAKAILLAELKSDFSAKNPDQKFNVKNYESEQLPHILTAEQYNQLLVINNRDGALSWAQGDWAELRKRQLTEGLDSVTTIHQIYTYDLSTLVAKERYVNDKAQLNIVLQNLGTSQPAALRKLKGARKNEGVATNTATGNLQW